MNDKFIEENKQLVLKAKQLLENFEESTNNLKLMSELKRKFHYVRDEASFYEQEIQDEFESIINDLSSKLKIDSQTAEDKKKDIINKTKQLITSTNFKKANQELKDLQEEWKLAGRCSKEVDDSLWEEFKSLKNQYFANRDNYFANLSKINTENEEKKLALIEKAIIANESDDIKSLTNAMNDLMNEWKQIKFINKEKDDELWNKFNAQRKIFYEKRNAYYESMKQTYAKRVEDKKELIIQAKHLLAMSEFSDDEVNQMTEIRNKWKQIGNAGKDNENELWEQFSKVVNRYLENMKYYR